MKDELIKEMKKEYEDIKMISQEDYSEIEKLEENHIVQRYNYLLSLKKSRFEFKDENRIIADFVYKYGQGAIEKTNEIWCLVYEITAERYENSFHTHLNNIDKDDIVLVYFDIENNKKHIVINKSEQENFESTHKVVVGKLSIEDSIDRYFNTRFEFFNTCLNDGQDVAIKKLLNKTKNKLDI